jgi:glycogen synthase
VRVALLSRGAHPLHEPGGMERAVYHLARHLQEAGAEVVLFTRPATREGGFPGEVVSVPYARVPVGRHGRILDRTLNYPGFALRLGEAVARRVRAGGVDVVDAQGLTALGYGRSRRLDPRLRAPLVMNPQGMEEHRGGGLRGLALGRLRRLSREAARLADVVIATDEVTRGEVTRLLGVEGSRVRVVPNGIALDEIAAATPADPARALAEALPGIAGAAPLLLSVGRLEEYKGFGDVAAALGILARQGTLPAGWAWAVVGRGPFEARLRSLCAGFVDRLHLLGHLDEALLHALYAGADVFVHAPHHEGSSLVTLEALAHGRPVLATRAGGIPDKITDGESGRLVAPGDVPALARALAELLADPPRARSLGARGAEAVRERFAWPRIARRTLALYEELLHGTGRGLRQAEKGAP